MDIIFKNRKYNIKKKLKNSLKINLLLFKKTHKGGLYWVIKQ